MHDAEEIDINDAPEIFDVAIPQLSHRRDGCIVENEIELSVSRRNVVHNCFHVRRTRHVQGDCLGAAISLFQCSRHFFGADEIDVSDDNEHTTRPEFLAQRASNSSRASGDERDAPGISES